MDKSYCVDKKDIPEGLESAFRSWYNEADIPLQDENGNWYDAETGFRFITEDETKKRKALSGNAQTARDTAKLFGGKALKGSAKQKEWAEKIRVEKMKEMTADQIAEVLNVEIAGHSKFWIESRSQTGAKIAEFIIALKGLYFAASVYHNSLQQKEVITEKMINGFKVATSNLTEEEIKESKRLWAVYDNFIEEFKASSNPSSRSFRRY